MRCTALASGGVPAPRGAAFNWFVEPLPDPELLAKGLLLYAPRDAQAASVASAEREQLPGLILADPLFLNPVTLEDEIPSVMKDLPEKSTSPGKTMGKMLLQAHKRGDLEKIADGM